MSLFAELQRRSVFKVGAAYLVVGWLVVQAASIAFPAFEASPALMRGFILIVLLGFPVALVLAWAFEMTPEGVKLDPTGVGSKRVFTRRDRARLKMALRGKRLGLSLAEIKDLIDMYCKTRAQGFGAEVKRRILIGTYVLSAGFYDGRSICPLRLEGAEDRALGILLQSLRHREEPAHAGIDAVQHIRTDAPFLDRARPIVLDQDVGIGDQPTDEFTAFRMLEVGGDRLLVAGLHVPPQRGAFVQFAPLAQGVAAIRRLNEQLLQLPGLSEQTSRADVQRTYFSWNILMLDEAAAGMSRSGLR